MNVFAFDTVTAVILATTSFKHLRPAFCRRTSEVLYMSFDRFLLAVESRDLSQADKIIIRVSSFSILQNFNF